MGFSGVTKEIDLSTNEPPVVQAMIEYFYTDGYNETESAATAETPVATAKEGIASKARNFYLKDVAREDILGIIGVSLGEYAESDSLMRESFLDITGNHIDELIKTLEFNKFAANDGNFSLGVLKAILKKKEEIEKAKEEAAAAMALFIRRRKFP
ncbi:hypothetical protein G7Y89_g14011 [Cudoniella acicularis]|uniref:Uncharacterized protein n=1 Tax=Cudoniella acicularis TaxID=354080 RepID=A0A8H4R8L0_9HELO|nr:hypothetical protein G7Y89_g14011 [Cudoniella acicularis]